MKISLENSALLKKCLPIIVEGALVLERIAADVDCTRDKFLSEVIAGGGAKAVRGIKVAAQDYALLVAMQNIRGEIFPAIENLIRGIAHKAKRMLHSDMDVEDLIQEGNMAFLKKICYFNRLDIKLSTFLTCVVWREIFRIVLRTSRGWYRCQKVIEIRKRFNKAKQDLNRHATFEEVIEKMGGLDKQELKLLKVSGLFWKGGKQVNDCDLTSSNESDDMDYTRASACQQWKERVEAPDIDMHATLRRLTLNPQQQMVLDGWLNDGTTGWQTRVAEKMGVTRQRIGALKEDIKEIVMNAYLNGNSAPGDEKMVGISYGHSGYYGKPTIKFGHGRSTLSLVALRVRHIHRVILEYGVERIAEAIEQVIEMTKQGVTLDKDVKGLDGISYGMNKYFNKPTVRFGHGNETCSLTAAKAKHILQAIRENSPQTIIRALETLIVLGEKEGQTEDHREVA